MKSADIAGADGSYLLNAVERAGVEAVATALADAADGKVNSSDWVAASRRAWHDLPASVRVGIGEFRRDSGPAGAYLVRGLPLDEQRLPDTPAVSGSVQQETTVAAALLMLFASGLGDPAAFLAEKSGMLVQDVVPVPGNEKMQGNEGSVLLSFHNENAFHEHRPDYVMLLCLRPDHERVAGLRVGCIRRAYESLDEECRRDLFRSEFVTAPPPSFTGGVGAEAQAVPHAVLTGSLDDPDLVVDLDATKPTTPRAAAALSRLTLVFAEVAETYYLEPGDLAIVDNRVAVHGRTAFTPRYDGRDRWLQRIFSLRDLRRSRDFRPQDGHVLVR